MPFSGSWVMMKCFIQGASTCRSRADKSGSSGELDHRASLLCSPLCLDVLTSVAKPIPKAPQTLLLQVCTGCLLLQEEPPLLPEISHVLTCMTTEKPSSHIQIHIHISPHQEHTSTHTGTHTHTPTNGHPSHPCTHTQ